MKKHLFFAIFIGLVLTSLLVQADFGLAQTACSPTPANGAPQLNIWPISESGQDCTDYPMLAAKNLSTGGSYVSGGSISANDGDRLRVRLYIHNGVPDQEVNIARNVMVAANIPSSPGSGTIFAEAWADNHPSIYSSDNGGDVLVNLQSNQYLEYLPGSALVYSRGPNLLGGLSDSVVFGGASLGDMRGCFQYLRWVTFEVEVRSEQTTATGSIRVNSNIPTSWVITGPETHTGNGPTGFYPDVKVSPPDYFIDVPFIEGYDYPEVTPSISQSLAPGETIVFDVYYKFEDGTEPQQGTLIVTCNNPPGGAWNISGIGHRTGPQSMDNVDSGFYDIIFDSFQGYITPGNRHVFVPEGETVFVDCFYDEEEVQGATLNPPVVTGVDNSVCAQLIVRWEDKSDNEEYFSVWRGTSATNLARVSGYLPANTTQYLDKPPAGQTYYYLVKAHTHSFTLEASSNIFGPVFNKICSADLSGAQKTLLEVTSSLTGQTSAYTTGTIINEGDTLKFQISIPNNGTAPAFISTIVESPSPNLIEMSNVVINKGTSSSLVPVSGNVLQINSSKPVGHPNWVITLNMKVRAVSGSQVEELQNCAVINYSDPTGSHNKQVCFGPILFKQGGGGTPIFLEV